jgi:hypothetical protein
VNRRFFERFSPLRRRVRVVQDLRRNLRGIALDPDVGGAVLFLRLLSDLFGVVVWYR